MDDVRVVLICEEAEALWNIIAYGWGDGEYAGLIDPRGEADLARRAMEIFRKALEAK